LAPPSNFTPTAATTPLDVLAKALAKASISAADSKLKLPPLEKFDGSADQVLKFISSVLRHVYAEPNKHNDVGRSILWVLDRFTGDAEHWAVVKSELIITGTNPWNSLEECYDTLRIKFMSLT
jgi:hypothetical protein